MQHTDSTGHSAHASLPQVSLCVLQYLCWVVQASAQRRAVIGKPGPAEVALAKRLLEVVKAASLAEATGVHIGWAPSGKGGTIHCRRGGCLLCLCVPPTRGSYIAAPCLAPKCEQVLT